MSTEGPVDRVFINENLIIISWLNIDKKENHFRLIKNDGIPWTGTKEEVLAAMGSKALGSEKLTNEKISSIAVKDTTYRTDYSESSSVWTLEPLCLSIWQLESKKDSSTFTVKTAERLRVST